MDNNKSYPSLKKRDSSVQCRNKQGRLAVLEKRVQIWTAGQGRARPGKQCSESAHHTVDSTNVKPRETGLRRNQMLERKPDVGGPG